MHKRIKLIIIVLVLLFSVTTVQAMKIEIPSEISVKGEEFTLGDIARITETNQQTISDINDITLGKTPLPGYSKNISKELIKIVLENEGYNTGNIIFKVPSIFSVKTATRRINIDELINLSVEYIKENIPYPAEDIIIKADRNVEDLVIPDNNYQIEVAGSKKIHLGNFSLPVTVNIDNKSYKRIYLLLNIKLRKSVFVAKRDIKRGSIIKRSDFKLKTIELTRDIEDLILTWDKENFENKIFVKSMKKGQFLKESYLKKPVVMNWGDKVKAVIQIGNVKVTTMVTVCGRGKIGEYVTVKNPKTNHKFIAKIINSQLVRVDDDQ